MNAGNLLLSKNLEDSLALISLPFCVIELTTKVPTLLIKRSKDDFELVKGFDEIVEAIKNGV